MSLTVNNADSISSLFSSLNSSSSSGSSSVSDLTGLISDYNSIRNGSYAKLTKQYYAKDGANKATSSIMKDTDSSTKSEITQNKALISDVASLRSSVSGITSDDTLFGKTTVKDDKGEEKEDYNYSKISSKLENFVKNYNSVIEAGSESDNSTVLRNVLNITNYTQNYSKQLEFAGISINSDNTLSFSLDSLKEAFGSNDSNVTTVKNLFGATSSFMRQVDAAATNVASQAASDVYSLGGYTSTGAYKQTLESIYNTTI